MSEEDNRKKADTTSQTTKKDAVTETLIDKSKSNTSPALSSVGNKKYTLGLPHILIGIVLVALIAGLIGYGASRRHDFDDRFERGTGKRGIMPMMGDRALNGYSNGDNFGSGAGTMRRGMYAGGAGQVNAVSSTSITIKPVQGGLTTYSIDSSTKIYNGTNTASVSDIKTGQTVRIQADQADSTKASQITIE